MPDPQKYLQYYSRVYPNAWKQADRFRNQRGKDLPFWPDWCFIPLAGAYAIVSAEAESQGIDITSPEAMPLVNDVGIIGALAAWRITKGVYRFDPDIYQEVTKTPLSGDLPHQILFNLPEWCIYIETPGMDVRGNPLQGFFAYLEQDAGDGRKELRFVFDFTPDISESPAPGLLSEVLHLGPWPLHEAVSRKVDETKRVAAQLELHNVATAFGDDEEAIISDIATHLAPLISLLLYICSVNAEIGEPGNRPARPRPRKTKKGQRLFPSQKSRTWDVGVRMGAALRRARATSNTEGETTEEESSRSSPRPHVRKAHWHLYWTGPRSGEQNPTVKWLPPIPVSVGVDSDREALPTVIHKVLKEEEDKDEKN